MIKSVTVYCSAREALDPLFYEAGAELGRALAKEKWMLVYGGNAIGIMKALGDGVRSAGGRVIGVTPQLFIDQKVHDTRANELVITKTMRDRKAAMEARGDAFIALPGGLGTFEEIFEIIVGRQLRYHDKPIVILNIAGYWDPMLAMLENGIKLGFIGEAARTLYHISPTVEDAIGFLRNPPKPPPQALPGLDARASGTE